MASEPFPELLGRMRGAFDAEETRLRAALQQARSDFDHRGVRGDVLENAVRAFLRGHLPRRLDVGTGEVIDRYGTRSPQLDVIIANEDQPLVYGVEEPGLYLAEGVSAIGEVKTRLDGEALGDILRKGAQLRQMRMTPNVGDQVQHSNPSDIARFVMSFPFFAIAMESSLSLDTIQQRLTSEPLVPSSDGSGTQLSKLDALFVLDKGVLLFVGDGTGQLQMETFDGQKVQGWGSTVQLGPLMELFMWINSVMPRVRRGISIALPYLTNMR
ncbi:hypothetical protein GCM10022286_17740 [Gryllotalpicola daejeonensis]|uniref:DUF6602 domain-containing protein n=1 Tax=Gryllotalpicola daejeonensis TaxID=993087 RepID=A0ABP7ZK27_9MICO